MSKNANQSKESSCSSCCGCITILFLLILILPATTSNKDSTSRSEQSKATVETGTISGYDHATKTIINPINIFKDYDNRMLGISGKARHGEKVTILERKGSGEPHGVKVRTSSGVVGWLSNWFVKRD